MTVTCTADAAHIICQSGLGEENMIQESVFASCVQTGINIYFKIVEGF